MVGYTSLGLLKSEDFTHMPTHTLTQMYENQRVTSLH